MASSSLSVNAAGGPDPAIDAANSLSLTSSVTSTAGTSECSGSTPHGYNANPPPADLTRKRSFASSSSYSSSSAAAPAPAVPDNGSGNSGAETAPSHGSEEQHIKRSESEHGTPSTVTQQQQHEQHQNHHQHQQQAASGSQNAAAATAAAATADGTEAGGAPKKRKTGRGARGVANLTPEQLERKRANDREAQRAIRERQRQRTEQYEREIAALKSMQPYQELQKVIRQKEAVEAELADVKRRIAEVVGIFQPVLSSPSDRVAPSDCSIPYQSQGRSHSLTQPPPAVTTHNAGSTPGSVPSPASVETQTRWQQSLFPVAPTAGIDGQQPPQPSPEMVMLNQQRYDLVHSLNMGSEKLCLDFLVDAKHKIPKIKSGIDGAQDSPEYRHVPMKHDLTTTMSLMPGLQGAAPTPAQLPSPVYSQTPVVAAAPGGLPAPPPPPGPLPIYALTPRNCPSTCPLDTILLDFIAERRQRAAEGLSQNEIVGPRYPSVSSLLNPTVSVYSHPLSKVFTDIIARFPDLSGLPERVAVLYAMFLLMRWQVAPTQENYARLPSWFRPVRQQTEKEHPAWFDHIPYPLMRERLVSGYEDGAFPFDNFFIPFTSTLSLNWPYEDTSVLLANPTSDELMINPVFEQHMMKLENWTLGEDFERVFPGLTGSYYLKRGS